MGKQMVCLQSAHAFAICGLLPQTMGKRACENLISN